LSGLGPTALFDLPWIPVYLGIIFAFHPLLGTVALCGALILLAITLMTEWLTRSPTKSASTDNVERHGLAETGRRNAEVLVAMGMTERMADRWETTNAAYLQTQKKMADVAGGFGAISKILRVMLQSAVLGVGAYLVIHQEATAGIIIAGSILTARAFAPVDLAIANWKGFVGARQSRQRLATLLEALPAASIRQPLPSPSRSLKVEALSAAPPGGDRLAVADVNFELKAGQGLGVIGPSAAGKSSLARLLVGVWQPLRGKVRVDGAALDQWDEEVLGRYIGYLPQDVELFAGTVAENISRFDTTADPVKVVAAAKAAGVHDLIVGLRHGYDTVLGGPGLGLSAGQHQRIALARALYGDPFLVVLDEPNSNLDADGEAALTQAILSVRRRGGIVAVVSHRPSALAGVDTVLIMNQGRAIVFGPKDEVLPQVTRPSTQPPPAQQPLIKAVPESVSLAS
jgi:ATP-binding cassette, subfamily C, bacterial PrsD